MVRRRIVGAAKPDHRAGRDFGVPEQHARSNGHVRDHRCARYDPVGALRCTAGAPGAVYRSCGSVRVIAVLHHDAARATQDHWGDHRDRVAVLGRRDLGPDRPGVPWPLGTARAELGDSCSRTARST